MKVISENEVNVIEAKKIMDTRKEEGELVYEQKICLDYLDKIVKFLSSKPDPMMEELGKIVILRPRHIALIMNVMPDTEEEVKALFNKEIINLKKEEIDKIIDLVKKNKK